MLKLTETSDEQSQLTQGTAAEDTLVCTETSSENSALEQGTTAGKPSVYSETVAEYSETESNAHPQASCVYSETIAAYLSSDMDTKAESTGSRLKNPQVKFQLEKEVRRSPRFTRVSVEESTAMEMSPVIKRVNKRKSPNPTKIVAVTDPKRPDVEGSKRVIFPPSPKATSQIKVKFPFFFCCFKICLSN